jgi:hypothetical protein
MKLLNEDEDEWIGWLHSVLGHYRRNASKDVTAKSAIKN